jgi:hypothetical protein
VEVVYGWETAMYAAFYILEMDGSRKYAISWINLYRHSSVSGGAPVQEEDTISMQRPN